MYSSQNFINAWQSNKFYAACRIQTLCLLERIAISQCRIAWESDFQRACQAGKFDTSVHESRRKSSGATAVLSR